MTPKNIFIHIGTHKTGTTSIQKWCTQNRSFLSKNSICYPSPVELGYADYFAHHKLALDIKDSWGHLDKVKSKVNEVINSREEENILFSAEPFYRTPTPLELEDTDIWVRKKLYIGRLRSLFETEKVTIIVFFRDQVDFLESLYKEHVLATSYTGTIESFIADKGHLADYHKNLRVWGEVFGKDNIIAIPYKKREALEALLNKIEVPVPNHAVGENNSNLSLTPYLIEIKRRLNKRYPESEHYAAILKKINQIAPQKTKYILNNQEAEAIRREKRIIGEVRNHNRVEGPAEVRPKRTKKRFLTLNGGVIMIIKIIFDFFAKTQKDNKKTR